MDVAVTENSLEGKSRPFVYFRRLVLLANRVSRREFCLVLSLVSVFSYVWVDVCSFIGSHMPNFSCLCGCYSVCSFARTFVCMLVFHVVVCISVCHKGCETLRAYRSREMFKVILLFPSWNSGVIADHHWRCSSRVFVAAWKRHCASLNNGKGE